MCNRESRRVAGSARRRIRIESPGENFISLDCGVPKHFPRPTGLRGSDGAFSQHAHTHPHSTQVASPWPSSRGVPLSTARGCVGKAHAVGDAVLRLSVGQADWLALLMLRSLSTCAFRLAKLGKMSLSEAAEKKQSKATPCVYSCYMEALHALSSRVLGPGQSRRIESPSSPFPRPHWKPCPERPLHHGRDPKRLSPLGPRTILRPALRVSVILAR